jgi:hypothetical protein
VLITSGPCLDDYRLVEEMMFAVKKGACDVKLTDIDFIRPNALELVKKRFTNESSIFETGNIYWPLDFLLSFCSSYWHIRSDLRAVMDQFDPTAVLT